MSTNISNVAVTFPNGFSNYADQMMQVDFTITGLSKGQTPNVTFPANTPADSVSSTGSGTWKATNTQTYEAQHYTMKIAGTSVSFTVHADGQVTDIKVG